jgi:outer membrane protein
MIIRKILKRFGFAFLMILLVNNPLIAQSSPDTLKLDVKSAEELALQQNPQITIALFGIESANAKYYETLGNFLPGISASASYNRNIKNPVIFMPDGPPFFGQVLELGSENSYNGGFSASMPVFNPTLIASLNASKVQKELSEEELRAAKIDLRYNVKVAFYNALLAKESLSVMNQRLENARKNLNNIKMMKAQGLVSEYDMLRAEVQTENLVPTVLQTENFYSLSISLLKTMLGLDNEKVVVIDGNLSDLAAEMLLQFNLSQVEKSLSQNTSLVQLDIQKSLINKQIKTVKAAALPSLAAFGNYQFQTQANDFKFSDYDWVQTSMAGLQLNVPIFSGFTIRNRAKQLEIASAQLGLQRDYVEDNLKIQLEDIIGTINLAVKKAVNAEKNVNLAQRAYDISLTRYESGQGTLLEVNDSEMALAQARFNHLQAVHEILKAKTDHEKFLGNN